MAERHRRPLISGNWKMHHTHLEAIQVVQKLSYRLTRADREATDISVHPAFTALRSVQVVVEADSIPVAVGAQDVHEELFGAFTGEISPAMLAALSVRYVIVGHSERRTLFGEGDEVVNRKAKAVLAAGMTPILCVGESLEEREAGTTADRVGGQLRAGLGGIPADQVAGLVLAYEPIWAIGTGRTATVHDAQEVCAGLRAVVGEVAGTDAAAAVRIQYGGSVKPANAAELLAAPDVDGALVGGASLDPDDFAAIVAACPRGG